MRVAVAGTFGPVHDGHRALFETALERGDEGVVVAVTSDAFATADRTRPVPPHEERVRRVREEMAAVDEWGRDVEVRTLTDEHGIAATDPDIDALVVSPETAPEIADINDRRVADGLDPLEGFVVPFVRDEGGERLSSTRLVAGEIDEHGALAGGEATRGENGTSGEEDGRR